MKRIECLGLFVLASAGIVFMTVSASAQSLPVTGNLELWLKADAGVQTSGGSVTNWLDQSGNGHNVTAPSAGAQPSRVTGVQNGLPVVRFDGANDHLNTDINNFLNSIPSITAFQVLRSTGPLTPSYALALGNDLHGFIEGFSIPDVNKWYWFENPNAYEVGAVSFTRFQALLSQNASSAYGPWVVGDAVSSGNPFAGDVAEVIVYNTALSATDRQDVYEYLVAKWAIPEPTSGSLFLLGLAGVWLASRKAQTQNGN